ncbi:MAG: TrkH family potassium uptake protein, partial [Halocynthiibacter sp.]
MVRLQALPLIVVLMGIGALAMFAPALYGYLVRDLESARAFFYAGLLFLVLTALIGIATISNPPGSVVRSQLLALLGAYFLLPLMLAVPFIEAVGNT